MILERYIAKEVAQAFLAVTLVLLLIVLSNRLADYLTDAAEGLLPANVIFILLGLKTIDYFGLLLPLAFYLGTILALGRLYRDNEMVALTACGVGPGRLYRALLVLGLPLVAGLALLVLYGAPKAAELGYELRDRALKTIDLTVLSAGRFRESSDGRGVIYIERLAEERGAVENVFVQTLLEGQLGILSAAQAYQYRDPESGDRFIVLQDGYRYEGLPGQANFRIVRFEKHAVRIQENPTAAARHKRDAQASEALWNSAALADQAELQWRISMPLSAALLTFLAVPLARVSPREGRYGKLLIAILVYIVYINLLGIAQVWLERGSVPLTLGLWWVHALLFALALGLLLRQAGPVWLRTLFIPRRARRENP